jgi:hypothetical protein
MKQWRTAQKARWLEVEAARTQEGQPKVRGPPGWGVTTPVTGPPARHRGVRCTGLICPISKLYAVRCGRCRGPVAARCQWQKNFVTIVTRLGLKTGGKLIP